MKERNYRNVGTLEIKNGVIDITDPCYDRNTWCRINDMRVVPGKYICQVKLFHNDTYGHRVQAIRIHLDGYCPTNKKMEYFDSIGVDAGLAGFFISPKKDYNDAEWQALCEWMWDKDKSSEWNKDEDNNYFITEEGFFSQSGYGDGVYDVRVAKVNNEIVAVEILFI